MATVHVPDSWMCIKTVVASLGSLLAFLIGDIADTVLCSLTVLIALDLLTGFYKAYKTNTISSRAFYGGIEKIFIYLACLVMTNHLIICSQTFIWLKDFVIMYIASNEALSILENLSQIDSTLIPEALKNKFKRRD